MKYLIVDDDRVCREVLHSILAPYGQCDLASSGQEAINTFCAALDNGEPYDLVCLDIMMPGNDGHAVLDNIRQVEQQRGILGSDAVKVIMTTGIRDPRECVQAFREGCEGFVSKPVAERQLLEQVQTLLGAFGHEASKPPAIQENLRQNPCGGQRCRYLVVDDDRVCREMLSGILSRFGDCDFADSGPAAVESVRKAIESGNPYNGVYLDILMPGMDGHETLTAIRELEMEHGIQGCDGTNVIMITAVSDSKQCIRAFREGCESFVRKPVRKNELLLRMSQLGLIEADQAML